MTDLLIHYIYVAFYPNGIPCYVGKGKGGRWLHHLTKSHNKRLAGVVRKAGGSIPIIKLRENLTEAEAFEIEIALIAAIGRRDLGTGPLLNLTAGGDGVVGHRRTPAQRKQMSVSRKGIVPTRETAAKISAKLKNVPKTPAHCAAVSAAKKNVPLGPMSALQRMAIGDGHRGRKRSAEECASLKIAAEKLRNDPVRSAQKSARISAALTGRKLSPQTCAKISAVQKNKPKGPMKETTKLKLRVGRIIKRWFAEQPVFVSEYAKWGDGASAGLL